MIPPIPGALSALGPQAAIGQVPAVPSISSTGGAAPASFGSELTNALGALDQTQQTATSAAQGLATGTVTDPNQAITAVENASLAMDLASQIQNKLVTATNTIFQTQV
jgi:flagellar hook-basal body complex protein FliE